MLCQKLSEISGNEATNYLDTVLLYKRILSVKRENLEDGGGLKVDIVGQGMLNSWS